MEYILFFFCVNTRKIWRLPSDISGFFFMVFFFSEKDLLENDLEIESFSIVQFRLHWFLEKPYCAE